MQSLINAIINALNISEPTRPYVTLLLVTVGVSVIVALAMLYGGIFIFFERRIAARMMSRIGPNRVGPQGVLQFVADAVKLILKEDLIPKAADRPLFRLAPYLMAMGVFAGFAVLPLSYRVIGADLNIGLLYVLAVTSVSVVGVLMSGWASNSKWALFGGIRSAAQIVSYEIPAALALLPAVLLSGTMSTQGIIMAQGAAPWDWYLFHSPMTFVLFFVYFISALAEGSRTPFDLPEAESELVSGYNTEYSGFRFAAYFTSEFANTWTTAAIGTIVFLGGWQIPFVGPETVAASTGASAVLYEGLGVLVFMAKNLALIFLIIQLRWTLPRVRVDQMMNICWKYLVPAAFVCTFLILGWMLVLPWESTWSLVVRCVMVGIGITLLVMYILRVRYNIITARAELYPHWIV
jgi:NADH-quinone oxidoreductase subunit H